MGVARWVVVCVVGVAVALGQEPGTDRPDITMFYKGNLQTCVAGSNTNGYGLAFMSERLLDNIYINQFEYKDGLSGSAIDYFSNCNFEALNSGCWWYWNINGFTDQLPAGRHLLSPVTDERWNDFPVYRTAGKSERQPNIPPEYDQTYYISDNFFTGISVRSTQNAQILLCGGYSKKPQEDQCYWIIIDGFDNFDTTGIRKCVYGVPDTWAKEKECKILRDNITVPEKLLDESKWTHFMLSRQGNNRVQLSQWDLDTGYKTLLNYMDESPIRITRMYLRSYSAIAEWKVHEYKFMNIRYKKGLFPVGPTLRFASGSDICVSLYVAVCPRCIIQIKLEKEDFSFKMQSQIQGNSNEPFMTWRNIRLEGGISTSASNNYQLYAVLSTIDGRNEENTFWAIDDFRKCSANEIRVTSVQSNKKMLCTSVKHPGWAFNSNLQVNNNEPPICKDERYIGKHCNVSCRTIFTDGCNNQKICLPTQRDNQGACTCAAGYTWQSDCTRSCSTGYYGYNCENECGKCKNNRCYINTGKCKDGCEEGYLPPYCQTTFPRLAEPPTVVKEFYTSVIVKFDEIKIEGSSEIAQSVQLECKIKEANQQWFNCSEQMKPECKEVPITGLKKETTYLIRGVVYTNTGYAYRLDDLPTVEATTTCNVRRDVHITQNSRNATINFETTAESCALDKYTIELLRNGKQNKPPQFVWQGMIFLDLTPNTEYTIKLTNTRFPSYKEDKDFKTNQDAPSEIQDLKILATTETEIVLSWKEPKEPNGDIQRYIVTYELIQRLECTERPLAHNGNLTVFPNEIFNVVISNLQPYSAYYITVTAETILPGNPTAIQANTTMISVISEDELPESISTSEPTAESVTVYWTVNCVNLRGPLYFQIVFRCVQDEWCDQIPDIVLKNVNSLRGITTHDLTPFTHYLVYLSAKRTESEDLATSNRTTMIYSAAGVPPAVRNFTSHSKNKTSISLRWLNPYPPHGYLDKYTIKYCSGWRCNSPEIKINQLAPCDLWTEHFNCYILTNLYSESEYTVTIMAQNNGTKLWSPPSPLTVYTDEDVPSAPLNLSREWKNNEINLYWNHPNQANGRLRKFIITLIQNGTELKNQAGKPFYSYEHPISAENKTYSYQIKKTYQYSSSYIVTVCGVNTHYGENATLHIDTPPETPELTGDVTVDEEMSTNTTVTIIIPSVKNNTKSKTSFLYVLVHKKSSSISKRQAEEENSLKQEILKHSNSKNTWIAIERELNEETSILVLGNGDIEFSNNLNEPIHNKELEPSSDYELTVVLINQYRDQRSSHAYRQLVQTTATIIGPPAALYALLLLLLLPVIGYFIYRYAFKKESRRASIMMMIPGLRVNRNEDQHDPDVIPLTEASTEPAQHKPKKPATTPKPGPSSKPTEGVEVPVEVNTTGTNFFHSRIVLLENLETYLKEALDNGDLDEQHALFPRGQTKPWDYGMLKPNKFKNRYNNLIAYDKNRVKLEKINNDQFSDYINASYIHGYRQDKAYIATQGPKLATVNDFWRMIWQEKTQYIVMLANVVEAGKKKCEKYWPEIDSSREYGFVDVYFEKSEVYADYEYRSFELTCKGEKRKVTQLHFTSWPDHGVPLYPQSLVPFLKKMLTIPQSTAPVVVHCSAGVGRTGTIILCDICLRMAAREKAIDPLRYLHEIREQRANMVDNIDQYKLVHMVLLECLLAPDTNIPCNADLSNAIQKLIEEGGLQIQLNYLQQSSWQDKALNFASAKQQNPANESKNRFNDIVPSENQVYISRFPVDDDNSDYINAVPVDGFRFKEQFIVTQTPMPNTVKDFWRMIAEKSVKIIVSLNDIPAGDTTSCMFWPPENEEMKPVPTINLKYHKLQSYDYYDIHRIILDNKTTQEATMIHIVQFKNWSHGNKLPQNEENLVMLWEETENLSHGNYPMVVTCYDGATASGLFVAMSFVIEKIKLEQQCDPCLAVRVIRRNRKQFVSNKIQFEFLYRSAVIYLSMFETYSNFQPVVNKQNNY